MAALPVDHAAVSTLQDPFTVNTICSSDATAASLNELQARLGVGPGWHAHKTQTPVLVSDLRRDDPTRWPAMVDAAEVAGVRSAFAFPLRVGTVDVGVANLYATSTLRLSEREIVEAMLLAAVAGVEILETALAVAETDADRSSAAQHPVVDQATRTLVTQLRVTPASALLIIRTHAYASNLPIRAVAEGIINGSITMWH
nr:GAF and ANTAR domain-containing protein [Microbacterium lemovicicum]